MLVRCKWAGTDLLYIHYHDTEWGVPLHNDRKLFEFLLLEGAQAGSSDAGPLARDIISLCIGAGYIGD